MILKIHLEEKHGKIMNVAKITEEKKNEILGTEYEQGAIFNPIQDKFDNWVVSLVEAQYLPITDFEVIEFIAPEPEEI